ncbi:MULTISPECIES: hypothetical protein [Tenacibaculum]|nr:MULTISPECIES: hypothetical protein [unclassified Tenacibaculum]SED97998.1 hypothetical protein SAMN04487765_0993 [Tenacibaculum sp. MAR_2010_89]
MIQLVNIPAVSWTNGTIMLIVFGIVSLGLIATLLIFMNSGKKKG